MTSFIEANFQTLTCEWAANAKIKRDVECAFDRMNTEKFSFCSKKYLFPVISNMFIFLSKPNFLFKKFCSWAKVCCETRYQKSTLNYGWNGRESDKKSTNT